MAEKLQVDVSSNSTVTLGRMYGGNKLITGFPPRNVKGPPSNAKEANIRGASRDCSGMMALWGGREKEERVGRRTLGVGNGDDGVRAV